jgi:hypothetical protein
MDGVDTGVEADGGKLYHHRLSPGHGRVAAHQKGYLNGSFSSRHAPKYFRQSKLVENW